MYISWQLQQLGLVVMITKGEYSEQKMKKKSEIMESKWGLENGKTEVVK